MSKKKIAIIVSMVVVIIGYLYFKKYDNNPYHEFKNYTNTTAAHLRSEDYLYIYKSHDADCEKLEKQIIDFASNDNVGFMSGNESDELIVEFDWENFHQINDIEIGLADENKVITYNEGVDVQKYLNCTETTDYGEIKKYQIIIGDKDYLKINPKAKLNHVYAMALTPDVDYHETGFANRFIVLDIPALYYRGDDESIKDCYFGYEEISAFLKEHS